MPKVAKVSPVSLKTAGIHTPNVNIPNFCVLSFINAFKHFKLKNIQHYNNKKLFIHEGGLQLFDILYVAHSHLQLHALSKPTSNWTLNFENDLMSVHISLGPVLFGNEECLFS